jgi:hypothetical protein
LDGATVTFIDTQWPARLRKEAPPTEIAACLGLDPGATGLVGWDVYDAGLTAG